MRILSLPKEFIYVAKHRPIALSAAADARMQKLKIWEALKHKGVSAAEIRPLLRVSRSTLYRWKKRLRDKGPGGLEEKCRRPHGIRKPAWSDELAGKVLSLRDDSPCWGKDTLVV